MIHFAIIRVIRIPSRWYNIYFSYQENSQRVRSPFSITFQETNSPTPKSQIIIHTCRQIYTDFANRTATRVSPGYSNEESWKIRQRVPIFSQSSIKTHHRIMYTFITRSNDQVYSRWEWITYLRKQIDFFPFRKKINGEFVNSVPT